MKQQLNNIGGSEMKTQFLVSPKGSKVRYYYNLADIPKDYNKSEIEDAAIAVLYNGVIVGYLNIDSVLYEIYPNNEWLHV